MTRRASGSPSQSIRRPERHRSHSAPALPRDDRTILFLGRISWKKRIDRLIDALPHIRDAQLIIAGNDEEGLTPRSKNSSATPALPIASLPRPDRFRAEVRVPGAGDRLRPAITLRELRQCGARGHDDGDARGRDAGRRPCAGCKAPRVSSRMISRSPSGRSSMTRDARADGDGMAGPWSNRASPGRRSPPQMEEAYMLDRITPLILTRDEEANIGRTLAQLAWAREVIVVDSMSTDATVAIARRFPNVRVVERPFDSHAAQWAFGVAQVTTRVGAHPRRGLLRLRRVRARAGARSILRPIRRLPRGFRLRDRWPPAPRLALSRPRAVLLRRGAFEFCQDGHTQRVAFTAAWSDCASISSMTTAKISSRFVDRQRNLHAPGSRANCAIRQWRSLPDLQAASASCASSPRSPRCCMHCL